MSVPVGTGREDFSPLVKACFPWMVKYEEFLQCAQSARLCDRVVRSINSHSITRLPHMCSRCWWWRRANSDTCAHVAPLQPPLTITRKTWQENLNLQAELRYQ